MADVVFRNQKNPSYGDPFIVRDGWHPNIKAMWISYLVEAGYIPQTPAWVPTYEHGNTVQVTRPDGSVVTMELNHQYFATKETADEMMRRFSAVAVAQVPYLGVGGPSSSSAKERWLVWPDVAINVGLLSANFDPGHWPDENAATLHCNEAIRRARESGQHLPVTQKPTKEETAALASLAGPAKKRLR